MKTASMFMVSVLAACAMAYDDVQVTYRGRLTKNLAAPEAQVVAMTFRLYGKKNDSVASWTATKEVEVNSSGLFQVSLSGNNLAQLIDEGKVNWIGVAVADGKEQYPRQELLAAPLAERAEIAERLGDSPSVVTAEVVRVETTSLTAHRLSASGDFTPPPSSDPVSMSAKATKAWYTLPIKGDVRFFRGAPPSTKEATSSGGGCNFGVADCNCAVLFSSTSSDIMPGMTLFFKKNESIALPSGTEIPDGTEVKCWIYPIGVE